jgi:hypothetical protein
VAGEAGVGRAPEKDGGGVGVDGHLPPTRYTGPWAGALHRRTHSPGGRKRQGSITLKAAADQATHARSTRGSSGHGQQRCRRTSMGRTVGSGERGRGNVHPAPILGSCHECTGGGVTCAASPDELNKY